MTEFSSVLIANRGEIAVRIMRTCADEGLRTIAVYAAGDVDSLHVEQADEAVPLPGSTAEETYLNIAALIDAALGSGAEAIHPGYGFLAESAAFASAVIDAGLVWIGPPPSTIQILGDKTLARQVAARVGAPLLPGTAAPVADADEVADFVRAHGLPIAIKAAYGGGGRGMRVVRTADEVVTAYTSATAEAAAAFGRGECFVERFVERPRHLEAQVLADVHGNVVVVGTRDCSLQRRHQKLIEEAPAPFLSASQQDRLIESAVAICRDAGYVGAGTVEYLLSESGDLSFLEVNTRLQVEHPVTEETTGLDLVSEQLAIARGEPLRVTQTPQPRGHSIEFRVNCEDPAAGFAPTPGRITQWQIPSGPGVRVDSGARSGTEVGGQFDSMVAKIVVSGPSRRAAIARSRRVLREVTITGVPTVLGLAAAILDEPAFSGSQGKLEVHTTWVEQNLDGLISSTEPTDVSPSEVSVQIGRERLVVDLPGLGNLAEDRIAQIQKQNHEHSELRADDNDEAVRAPMQGTVVRVNVANGDWVEAGDQVAAVEAMKMENPVLARRPGRVVELSVKVGDTCHQGEVICRLADVEPGEPSLTLGRSGEIDAG